MPLSNADTARLAHRVLRLKESGIDSRTKLSRLSADARRAGHDGERIGFDGNPLARVALATETFLDSDAPGPTDSRKVESLFNKDLTDIWKSWEEATTANLEESLSASDLKHWRASKERDQKVFEERQAEMEETGEFPVHPYFGHMRHLDGAANALYDVGRKGFADGAIALLVATIKVVLVDSADYTANLATDQFLSSIASAAREETSPALTTKTTTAGVFDADDTTFTAAAGDPCEAMVIVQSSAVGGGADVADTAQRLIGFIDIATGLPVTLNGGNINVVWDNTNRIFKL